MTPLPPRTAPAEGPVPEDRAAVDDTAVEYAAWLERLTATVEAVSYTCRVRLRDPVAAEAVALRVASGLLSRPAVFRHWGLPYSGRIATLAEDAIAAAHDGSLRPHGSWGRLRRALSEVPAEHRATLVLACVEGHDDARLAAGWSCSAEEAGARRAATIAHLRELVTGHGDPAAQHDRT